MTQIHFKRLLREADGQTERTPSSGPLGTGGTRGPSQLVDQAAPGRAQRLNGSVVAGSLRGRVSPDGDGGPGWAWPPDSGPGRLPAQVM